MSLDWENDEALLRKRGNRRAFDSVSPFVDARFHFIENARMNRLPFTERCYEFLTLSLGGSGEMTPFMLTSNHGRAENVTEGEGWK